MRSSICIVFSTARLLYEELAKDCACLESNPFITTADLKIVRSAIGFLFLNIGLGPTYTTYFYI